MSKLTNGNIIRIRQLRKKGLSQYRVAEIMGVSRSNIYLIDKGITWKHIKKITA